MKNLIGTILLLSIFTFFGCSSSSVEETPAMKSALENSDTYAEIPWVKMDDVEYLVGKKSKKILVDVYTPWCGPCKMMDRMTFTDANIINQISKNFYAVKFNAEGPDPINFQGKEYGNPKFDPKRTRGRNAQHELSPFFAVRGYPSLVILDENMKVVGKIVGFKQPAQLKVELEKYM